MRSAPSSSISRGSALPPTNDPNGSAARRFYELTDDAFVKLDAGLGVVEANPAASRLLGEGAVSFATALHEEDRATALVVLEAARLAGAAAAFEARAPDEAERWIEWRILPGEAGTATLFVIGRDATIRRVHRREIETARDSTRQTTRLRTAFLDNLSHEIRTPLNVILGYVAVVEDEIGASGVEPPTHILDGLRRASERLVGTIDAILDLAKVEAGIYSFRPAAIALGAVVEKRALAFRPAALAKGLELRFENRLGEVSIEFDERALATALASLLDNAIKFTDQGGIEVVVARDGDGCLVVDVADSGIGIEESIRAYLFQPFAQGESGYARRFEGTGVGLALARRLLELGGATIEVESEVGRGTRCRIRFAATRELRAEPPVAEDGGTMVNEAPPVRTTALIVEDDPDTQVYMQAVLRRHYEILLASSGEEVRRHLEAKGGEIGIVLMDLSLRGSEDGLVLTREIRASEKWRHLPIIATTAHAFPEDRERVIAAGCNAYLAKPFNHRDLLTTMADLLRKPA